MLSLALHRRSSSFFEENGYRKQLVRRLQREAVQSHQHPTYQREQRRRANHGEHLGGYLTLSYVDEGLCAKVNAVVRKCDLDVKVDWQSKTTSRAV